MQAGALSIFRDPESGRVTGTTAGTVSDTWSYNPYGEPSAYAATAGGSPLLSFAYERDDLGRITKKTEVRNGGAARVVQYGYDDAGRLETVTEDGGLAESYAYDANGNRTSSMNSAGVFSATYDDQDRIETYGSMVYGFSDNGELESKLDTLTGDLTTYEYDALGNLRSVVLPDGTEIEYLVDGQGRRVGKLVGGVLEQAWLWRGQLQPVAELDGAGNVVARYVYAGGVNVPEAIVLASGPTYRCIAWYLGGRMTLTVEFDRETDGRWIAEVLELPGVLAYGESREHAVRAAKALALHVLADRIEHGEGDDAALDTVAFVTSAAA